MTDGRAMAYSEREVSSRPQKIEPRISVPCMLELEYESKIIFKNYQ